MGGGGGYSYVQEPYLIPLYILDIRQVIGTLISGTSKKDIFKASGEEISLVNFGSQSIKLLER